MKLFTSWIINLLILLGTNYTGSIQKMKWINNLIEYFKNDNREYQVLILFDPKNESPSAEDIMHQISKYLPSVKISFQEATIAKALALRQLPSFQKGRTSMIIVIHLPQDKGSKAQLNDAIDFSSQLAGITTRPRCLIVLPQEDVFSYRKFLEEMWNKQFLDSTLLELSETKMDQENNFLEKQQNQATPTAFIHQYNPFTNTNRRFKFSKTVPWFPEKTQNLNGLKLKIGVARDRRLVYVQQRNGNKGNITIVSGPGVDLIKELSKALNFKIVWSVSTGKNAFGRSLDCSKENSTGLVYKLLNNQVAALAIETARYISCVETLFEHSKGTYLLKLALLVPIRAKETSQVLIKPQIFTGMVFVTMFLFVWIASRLLIRDNRSLSLLQVTRIVLGTPAPTEPRNVAERIVFGSIIFSCLMYSSFIYTLLTEINLKIDTKEELETIKDVVSSDLQPVINSQHYSVFYEAGEEDTRLLLNKSMEYGDQMYKSKNCLTQLAKKKNVACVKRLNDLEFSTEETRDSCGRPFFKILYELLISSVSGMDLAPGSPYVRRFDEIIQRLIQSGIVAKWRRIRFNPPPVMANENESCSERGSETTQLKKQVIYLFLFGYVCATAAFFSELIIAYYVK